MNPNQLLLGTKSWQPEPDAAASNVLGELEGGAKRPLGGGNARKDAAVEALDERAAVDEENSERAEQTQVDAEAGANRR